MPAYRKRVLLVCAVLLVIVSISASACSVNSETSTTFPQITSIKPTQTDRDIPVVEPTATIEPPRTLNICIGNEPASLFLYGDASKSARNIRQAIYDGPIDLVDYEYTSVILQRIPTLENRDALLEPVQVESGDLIVDHIGTLVNLNEGVLYRPSGCKDAACVQSYAGVEPVLMDQLIVRFEMLPGLKWSDGEPLTADDSMYSYEVAQALRPRVRPDLLARTHTYLVLDETTIEWRGVPGFMDPNYRSNFFTPLPRHAWGSLEAEELLTAEISTRAPIGWGPYVIDEWAMGEQISLSRNSLYFRSGDGLPYFDNLVFRFIGDAQGALKDLQMGSCDYLDESLSSALPENELLELGEQTKISYLSGDGNAWEHLDFGINSFSVELLPLFSSAQVRQAVAFCTDRERIVDALFPNGAQVLDSYLPPSHPLFNPEVARYAYDPQRGSMLLDSIGWIDHDNDASTPRIANGISDLPDGTPFVFTYLATDESGEDSTAQMIQESLAECGIEMEIEFQSANELFASGPLGPVFGRQFSIAQYAWASSMEPPCFLYTTSEVPGPYPDYAKGWGGANAPGFSKSDYDQACLAASNALPDWEEHRAFHNQAQAIYSQELPSLPIYLHRFAVIVRSDLCGVSLDPLVESQLWNIEAYDYGENCQPEVQADS